MTKLLYTTGICLLLLVGCSPQKQARKTDSEKTRWQPMQATTTPQYKVDSTTIVSKLKPIEAVPPEPEYVTAPYSGQEPVPMPVQFSVLESQHVRLAWMTPRVGEMLTISMHALQTDFCYPYKGKFLSGYGIRNGNMHTGVDIKAIPNDTIRAMFSGIVRMSKLYSAYGNIVVIRHESGIETLYGHNSKNLVKVNDRVKAGDPIALAGRTGRATTDHLHLEVRAAGSPLDPTKILDVEKMKLRQDTLYIFNKGGSILSFNNSNAEDVLSGKERKAQNNAVVVEKTLLMQLVEDQEASKQPKPTRQNNHNQAGKNTYIVQKGDILSKIAKQNSISVEELCRINNIANKDDLKTGQVLILSDNTKSENIAEINIGKSVQKMPEHIETPVSEDKKPDSTIYPSITAAQPIPVQLNGNTHTVKRGESLSMIARQHKMTVEQICKLNNIENPDALNVGQVLSISGTTTQSPSQQQITQPQKKQETKGPIHVVKSGDSLYKIAKLFGTTVAELCRINNIEETITLQLGQRIKIE